MQRIDRYILRQLVVGLVVVTAGLLGIVWLSQSLRFVEFIVEKGLGILAFLELTVLMLPNFLAVVLPIALFAVVLFLYNRLIADREFMVLQGAGVSPLRLARPVLVMGVAVTLLCYVIYIAVLPETATRFREMRWSVRHGMSSVILREGTFTTITDGLTIYVRERTAEDKLLDVIVNDRRGEKGAVTLIARRGMLTQDDKGAKVVLADGSRQTLDPETGELSLLYFDTYTTRLAMADEPQGKRYRDAHERTVRELLSVTRDEVSEHDYGRFRAEAHQRLAWPLFGLAFPLVALAFLVTGDHSRRGHQARVLAAIVTMVGLQTAALGINNLAANMLALSPLIYLNAVLPIPVALWFLLRAGGARRFPRPA